jgi:hypothetical protein
MNAKQEYELTSSGCWLPRGDAGTSTQRSRAARRVFRIFRGPIPAGTVVGRSCSEPACVSPWHLQPLTPAEAAQRGHRARLTPDDVLDIRRLRALGVPRRRVAALFDVHETCISHITARRRWRSVS